jgi:hypothetical protein
VFSDVSGVVLDPVQSPVAGATLQAYDLGRRVGSAVLSDANGAYDVTGPFTAAVVIYATKDGYRAGVNTNITGPPPGHGFADVLIAPTDNAQIAPGAYTLTINAGAGCNAIPPSLRTVVYPAKVSPADDRSGTTSVMLSNTFPEGPDVNIGFEIGIAGQQAEYSLDDTVLVQELPGATYLMFEGSGTATIANSPATILSFDTIGKYDYCVLTSPMPRDQWTTCSILPADRVIKHATCPASGFVLSATQDQGAALTRRRR